MSQDNRDRPRLPWPLTWIVIYPDPSLDVWRLSASGEGIGFVEGTIGSLRAADSPAEARRIAERRMADTAQLFGDTATIRWRPPEPSGWINGDIELTSNAAD